ncbi:hypothetical protein AACH06_29165 [Ideonella sp. DXS29W]|uniref:Uncharacterized protein n=1 Tax=Ideonella lacteola TaxID=2984193 RepID=A0ABU9C1E7_9BURK
MAALLGTVVPFIWLQRKGFSKDLGPLEQLQSQADQSLRSTVRQSNNAKLSFIGTEAVILSRQEEITWFNKTVVIGYRCTYFVRNRHGEHFLFIHRHDAKPHLKHTSQRIARVKLGAKYIAPPSDG